MNIAVLLSNTLITFISFYTFLLIARILLSWFPNINWFDPPFSILSQLTDPYLNVFRSIIPPLGGIDFSPILALLLLQVLQSIIPPLTQAIAGVPVAFGA